MLYFNLQMSLIIIKLGGSVITYKDNPTPKPRIKIIKNLSKDILTLYKKNYQIIIVHGAGSFAHQTVKKYQLTDGLKDQEALMGFSQTTQSMNQLNSIILNNFEEAGIPVISLPPHSFITQTNGNLEDFDTAMIKDLIDLRLIPVLYGDLVVDKKIGCSVISGDTITTYLGKKLQAEEVIFLTDVDGIFDNNPKVNPDAQLIRDINNENIDQVIKSLTPHNSHDVTGEMRGKVLSIQKDLKGKKVIITNGLKPRSLLKAMDQSPTGTMLHLD